MGKSPTYGNKLGDGYFLSDISSEKITSEQLIQ